MDLRRLLCLGCRKEGHMFDGCNDTRTPEDRADWMFSRDRMVMNFDSAWGTTEHKVCARCRDLDILGMLQASPPWTTQAELTEAFEAGNESIKNLGKAGRLRLRGDCSVCRCLFAMTPNPQDGEQDVLLLPDWTLNRLAGEDGVHIDSDNKRQSATCLVVALKPSTSDLPVSITAHRGDALCLIDSDLAQRQVLGGRKIDQSETIAGMGSNTPVSHRFRVLQRWINTCVANHGAVCSLVQTEALNQIRLLDVRSRTIIAYPEGGAEYVALSYVCGDVKQLSYRLGDNLENVKLPKTIEDAIWFTGQLERQYLWVDSICINQEDAIEKAGQIDRMSAIYSGAVVTLLALSGRSADAGIPRLGRSEKFSQITCCINGKRLVGLMPTLSQQIWVCPWGKRAWTLQEAILSPRCLYFSDHQIHFECKAMQCCESLEETRSPNHRLSVRSAPVGAPFVLWMAQQLGPGCLRIDSHSGRLDQYGRKLTLYSFRDMTDPNDSLNAFKGVLQKMKEFYPRGWYEGLPVEDFDWALLWRHHYPAVRRRDFPSWSWAGWKGRLWHGQPIDVAQPRRFPVHLSIHKAAGGQIVPVFDSEEATRECRSFHINITNDAVDLAWNYGPVDAAFDLAEYPVAELRRYLFVDAIVFQFATDFSSPQRWTPGSGEEALFNIYIKQIRCLLGIMTLDREIVHQPADEIRNFVLIARDHTQGFIIHHLMLIKLQDEGNIAERATVVQLLVPLDNLEILAELSPQRRRIVLA